MQVRRLQIDDSELARKTVLALKLADNTVSEKLTTGYLRGFLNRPENYLIVATIDRVPIGYLVAYELDRIDRYQTMILCYEIRVAESHRRSGAGTAMINLLKSLCEKRKVMKMWVHTTKSNVAGTRLYESTGGIADPSGDEITYVYIPTLSDLSSVGG